MARIMFPRTVDHRQQFILNREINRELKQHVTLPYTSQSLGKYNQLVVKFMSEQEFTMFCMQWNKDNQKHLNFMRI